MNHPPDWSWSRRALPLRGGISRATGRTAPGGLSGTACRWRWRTRDPRSGSSGLRRAWRGAPPGAPSRLLEQDDAGREPVDEVLAADRADLAHREEARN